MQVRQSLKKYYYPAFFSLFRSFSLLFALVSLTNLALIIFLLGCIPPMVFASRPKQDLLAHI